MMKLYMVLFIISLLLLFVSFTKAQTPILKTNTSENERATSIIYKNFSNQYDLLIAYTSESYWYSSIRNYQILAFKNSTCLKGYFYSKKNKHNVWSKPKIKFKGINCDSANSIVKHLNDAGFYSLNRDSLNINRRKINGRQDEILSVDDGVNYKFEIFNKNNFIIIESYMPEYFLQKIPELKSRETFIKCRDFFLLKYNAL
jgi:hypothetical protein